MGAGVLWGLTGVLARAAYNAGDVAPLFVSFLRMGLAVPVLLVAWALIERPNQPAGGGTRAGGRPAGRVGKRGAWLFFVFGVVAALYQVLYFSAVSLTTVTSATLILALAPLFVALWGRLFLGEVIGRRTLAWGTVAVLGAALVVVGGAGGAGDAVKEFATGDGAAKVSGNSAWRSLLGDVLALGAAVAYSLYYVLARQAFRLVGPLNTSIRVFSWAAFLLGVVALATGQLRAALPPAGWLALLGMGLVGTGAAYVFYFTALARTKAVLVSLGGLLEPVTAAALAWLVFGESLGVAGVIGAVMLLAALTLLSVRPRPARVQTPPAQAE